MAKVSHDSVFGRKLWLSVERNNGIDLKKTAYIAEAWPNIARGSYL